MQKKLKHLCASEHKASRLEFKNLLKLNIDLNFTYDNHGLIITPLMITSNPNYKEPMFNLLIKNGADYNYITPTGLSLVLYAAREEYDRLFIKNKP